MTYPRIHFCTRGAEIVNRRPLLQQSRSLGRSANAKGECTVWGRVTNPERFLQNDTHHAAAGNSAISSNCQRA